MLIFVALMSVGCFAASAAVEEAGSCGKRTGDVAVTACGRLIKVTPKVFALVSRGNAYKDKGDVDHAISDYSEAIRLNPKYALAFNNRGNAYRAKGELDRAISDYNEALRLDPEYGLAFYNRGNTYLAKNEEDRAIVDFSEAIRLDSHNPIFLMGRATSYVRLANLDAAIADLDSLLRRIECAAMPTGPKETLTMR
jgi:tetratricopeptide (TPR) repeat protein